MNRLPTEDVFDYSNLKPVSDSGLGVQIECTKPLTNRYYSDKMSELAYKVAQQSYQIKKNICLVGFDGFAKPVLFCYKSNAENYRTRNRYRIGFA